MIPPARDPRMDRPEVRRAPAQVTVVRLGATSDPVRTGVGSGSSRFTRAVGIVAGVLLALVVYQWPRAQAYPELVEQNLLLKTQLQGIEHRMDELDRMTERLRLYDAQLRGLTEARGAHGPIPEFEGANSGILEHYQEIDDDVSEAPELMAADLLGDDELDPLIGQPAAAWAEGVAGRVDDFVELFSLSESDLAALMADLETLGAIQRSLPQRWPAEGRLTSGFGWRRDPLRRYTKFHNGLDIANRTGSRVRVVSDGVVVTSAYQGGYGHVIDVDHGFGITTRYAHLSRRRVREGDRVTAGQAIGTMGSTGRSTGPHLHFELRIDGSAHDPLKYLPR